MTGKNYTYYVQSFKEWMKVLGYSESAVYGTPRVLQEFFTWLENKGITTLEQVQEKDTTEFIDYNKTRANRRREGGLGVSHINRYIETIKKFNEYTRQTQSFEIPITVAYLEKEDKKDREILSTDEVKLLFTATDETPFGMRDRAMLALYYGCGLRKSEASNLDLNDILIERKLVYVRKTKNNYERYVPITTGNLRLIEQYIYNARLLLVGEKGNEHGLFISERGTRIGAQQMYLRVKQLCQKAGITKEIGTHSLRHSIATHLLQAGMELENIALFLGHRCLDSTQLYTQIMNEQ
jgi:integrase/recombinase XerD